MNLEVFSEGNWTMRACADLLLVASQDHLNALGGGDVEQMFPGLVTFPTAVDERVPESLLGKAQVVVVEVDPGNPGSLDRLKAIGRAHPQIPRIAAITSTTVSLVQTLVREGVTDVVTLPFNLEELLDVSLRACAEAKARHGLSQKLAPQVAVVRSIGGCGASSLVTHLGSYLAAMNLTSRPMALVDLDLQDGSVAEYLGAEGTGTVADLLGAGERLDEELLRSVARMSGDNLATFAAPVDIQPIEAVDTDRVLELLTMIRQCYGAVLVDLPTDWTNWAVSVLSASDLIVMVVELNVNSLRQAKRRLELLAQIGIDPDRIVLVVNRVERRMFRAIDLSDVSETLRREVIGTLPLEGRELASAQAQGSLVDTLLRKSKFAAAAANLARIIAGRIGLAAE